MKYAMLVHPFYNYIRADEELALYKEASKKYDIVYAYLPVMSDAIRREMFSLLLSRGLVNFILESLSKSTTYEDLKIPFPLRAMQNSITHDMYEIDYAIGISKYTLYLIAQTIRRANIHDRSALRKILKGKTISKELSDSISKTIPTAYLELLFYSDHHNCPNRMFYINSLLEIENIVPLWYGATNTVDVFGGLECFPDISLDHIGSIDLFGTYYNVCVKSIMSNLKMYKDDIKIRRIKRWSSYSTTKDSFVRNNENKYFGIYHNIRGAFYRNGKVYTDEGEIKYE